MAAPGNRFLAKLPEAEYRNLLPHLKPVKLAFKQVLHESRGPIDHAYFPISAVTSALTTMSNGDGIEVATVGFEGLVGHTVAIGGKTSPNKVIVQIADGGLRIEARILREHATRGGPLQNLLTAYDTFAPRSRNWSPATARTGWNSGAAASS